MDSASFQFVSFGLAAALISNLGRPRWWRTFVLLLSSLAFLLVQERNPWTYLPLVSFLVLGYLACRALQKGWMRSPTLGVVAIVLVYIWLKKYSFLPSESFLRSPYFTLGLSYIFFRVLHLVIESGEGGERPCLTALGYLLYTLNFATLVSGPIQRYSDFARDQEREEPLPLTIRTVGLQLERIVRGFFKVNVLAVLLNAAREDALDQYLHPYAPAPLRVYAAFKLAVVYPFFLYCNFSGYIDIVIALARLMRLRLPENFDRPFSSLSFLDFWNRWHITLSSWLKTYVYNPLLLALMRRCPSRAIQPFLGVFCFFATFFLIGVWHGRTPEFLVFGLLQGTGMAANKLWQIALAKAMGRKRYKALGSNAAYGALARGLTFTWFAFTLLWFWAGWDQIRAIFHALDAWRWLGVWGATWLTATIVLAAWEQLRAVLLMPRIASGPLLLSRYSRVVYASALGFMALVLVLLLNQPVPDIMYRAF